MQVAAVCYETGASCTTGTPRAYHDELLPRWAAGKLRPNKELGCRLARQIAARPHSYVDGVQEKLLQEGGAPKSVDYLMMMSCACPPCALCLVPCALAILSSRNYPGLQMIREVVTTPNTNGVTR